MAKKPVSKYQIFNYILEFPATITVRQTVQIQALDESGAIRILKERIKTDDFDSDEEKQSSYSNPGVVDSHRNMYIYGPNSGEGKDHVESFYKADLSKIVVYEPNNTYKNSYKDTTSEQLNDYHPDEYQLDNITNKIIKK